MRNDHRATVSALAARPDRCVVGVGGNGRVLGWDTAVDVTDASTAWIELDRRADRDSDVAGQYRLPVEVPGLRPGDRVPVVWVGTDDYLWARVVVVDVHCRAVVQIDEGND